MSRRRGEGRKRIAALEAELRILAGEIETHRVLIDRQAPADPQRMADVITDAIASVRACDFTAPADDDLPIWHPESLSNALDPDDEDVFTACCFDYAEGQS